jgi:exonuclease III
MKIAGNNNHCSLISLNIKGLKSLIKGHRLREWIQKQNTSFCCIQETYLSYKDRYSLGVNGLKKSFPRKLTQNSSWNIQANI